MCYEGPTDVTLKYVICCRVFIFIFLLQYGILLLKIQIHQANIRDNYFCIRPEINSVMHYNGVIHIKVKTYYISSRLAYIRAQVLT